MRVVGVMCSSLIVLVRWISLPIAHAGSRLCLFGLQYVGVFDSAPDCSCHVVVRLGLLASQYVGSGHFF